MPGQADQEEGGRLVKRPGDKNWMPDTSPNASRIITIKCKDGSYAVRVTPDMPAHTPGIQQGNAKGSYEKMQGHNPDGTSTSRRSTGVNPKAQEPIDPSMPNLSPG